jgi:hypothetical protein
MQHTIKPKLTDILTITLKTLNVSREDWERYRKTRMAFIIRVKELFCQLAYERGYSHENIGRFIGLHRTSVISRIKTLQDLCDVYPKYCDTIDDARVKLQEYILGEQLEDVSISYLARSSTGLLIISPSKPNRVCGYWIGEGSRPYYPQTSFPQITWESEPVMVKIKVTLENHEEV